MQDLLPALPSREKDQHVNKRKDSWNGSIGYNPITSNLLFYQYTNKRSKRKQLAAFSKKINESTVTQQSTK